jgi:hypothetical protein
MRAARSGESALLLLDVVELLADEDVDYAVVGAMAATFHGAMRASRDADMVLSVGIPQAERIAQKLRGQLRPPDLLSIMSWFGGLQNGSAQMHWSLRSGS